MARTLWNTVIEHLPLPASFRSGRPRLVNGEPILRSSGGRGILAGNGRVRSSYDDENRLIDELDDDWGEETERY